VLLVLIAAFALLMGYRVGRVPQGLLYLYGLASLVTLVVYAWDKYAARRGRRRVPERMLHWLAVIGGWPGALLAQQWLRHKTVKKRFRGFFYLTLLINIGLVFLWQFNR
jgi:uncharacterized membrane protein YsdA (DUF1294 family)